MSDHSLHRLAAFTENPEGGNRAGVWIGDALPDPATMQAIATEVGYSETAFLAPSRGQHRQIRYYSPAAEVSFCGHATIAAGVVLGQQSGPGQYQLSSAAGEVGVDTRERNGVWQASLSSVTPQQRPVPAELLETMLSLLGWQATDLDPAIPPMLAYAGAWHLVLVAAKAQRLDTLDYPFDAVRQLMLQHELTTLQLVHGRGNGVFDARNPFPVGGVVEDPATGAAAAAFGGYLRDANLLTAPAKLWIHQGHHMGRPSLLEVDIPASGGITVSGAAVLLGESAS